MPTLRTPIVPCLWFDTQAEEAATFYTGIFPQGRILRISHYGQAGYEIHRMKAGTVMTVEFQLDGQTFTALNGGPVFNFNEAVSLQVYCQTQAEIDRYWEKLSAGGDERARQCGWLKDQYGLSWQVVPSILPELMLDPDPARTDRVMQALLQMKKLDIAGLKQAYDGTI